MELTRLPVIEEEENTASAVSEIKSYLIRLDRILSVLLSDLGEENLGENLKTEIISEPRAEISSLRDEIIRTASEIKDVRDSILLTLSNNYLARSEAGTVAEEAFQRIEIDGKGVTQYFEELSAVSARQTEQNGEIESQRQTVAGLVTSLSKLGAYIRTGKLDDTVYGIEIGNFSENEAAHYKVRLSENRLSFFIGSEETAYFSDNSMYINNASFPNALKIGNCVLSSRNGLSVSCS